MTARRRSTESQVYRALRTWNDVKAVRKGRVPRRIARRAYGRLARKLFG